MAVRLSNAARSTTANESWKARGFANFEVVRKDGSVKKLGAIPLRASNEAEASLAEWLEQDPEKNAAQLLKSLRIVYRSAEPQDKRGFVPDEA